MPGTVSIEVPVEQEQLVRRFLALNEELTQLALSAPDGTVFDACESAVITGGREVQTRMREEAVARRIEAAEKRGPRSGSARAVGSRRTADPKTGNS
jgi:hypothetical protein